jgi:DME family drug/metabolite transporter
VSVMAIGEPFAWLTTRPGLWMAFQLGILATGLAYLLYGFGLARLTSATTVTLVLAEPLTATALAAVVLDESIVAVGWIGIAVLCAGLLVVGRTADVSFEPVPAAD